MNLIYPFFIAFSIVFFAELGDKTQLLVLSLSTKTRTKNILIGVALGTFFSHGLAIIFGSKIGSLNNDTFKFYLDIFTYISFIFFGIIGFINKNDSDKEKCNSKSNILSRILNLKLNYIFIVAINIVIGEIGDKTFLASLGLGLQYPEYKISLIFGSIFGMVLSNLLAIIFGKIIGSKFNQKFIEFLSNIIFIIFGILGIISIIF